MRSEWHCLQGAQVVEIVQVGRGWGVVVFRCRQVEATDKGVACVWAFARAQGRRQGLTHEGGRRRSARVATVLSHRVQSQIRLDVLRERSARSVLTSARKKLVRVQLRDFIFVIRDLDVVKRVQTRSCGDDKVVAAEGDDGLSHFFVLKKQQRVNREGLGTPLKI